MDQTGSPGLDVTRVLAGSIALGAVVFWIVGWVMTGGGREGLVPGAVSTDAALWIVVGAFAAGIAGALVFRGRALGLIEQASRSDQPLATDGHKAVSTSLMIAWTMIEVPALISGILFLLLAETLILGVAVPAWAVGVALTFPRAEWFDPGALQGHETEHGR